MQPHRIFLWIALTCGIALVCVTPPFQVPDEFGHFYRAYQVSEGGLLGTRENQRLGGTLPSSLRKVAEPFTVIPFHRETRVDSAIIATAWKVPLNAHERVFIDFCGQGIMLPIAYIPQAIGIGFIRLWNPPVLALVYAGRVTNLLAWALLTGLAIRLIPRGKWVLATLALAPMCLFEAASLSYDAFANGSSFLLLAYVLKRAQDSRSLSSKEFVLMGLLALAPALTKPFYFPCLLLPLLIAIRNGQWRDKRWIVFGGICGVIMATAWWLAARNFISFEDYDPTHRWGEAHPLYAGANPALQLIYIFQHPLSFFHRLVEIYFDRNTWCAWIGLLGWVDTPMPGWFYGAFALALLVAMWWDRPEIVAWNWMFRSLMVGVALAACVATVASLYMQATPVGALFVNGFQGRYVIPVIPPALFALQGNRCYPAGFRRLEFVWPFILLAISLLTFGVVYLRYYHFQ